MDRVDCATLQQMLESDAEQLREHAAVLSRTGAERGRRVALQAELAVS